MRYAVALSTLAVVVTAACTDGPTALAPGSGTAPPTANSVTTQTTDQWALDGGCVETVPGTFECGSTIRLGEGGIPAGGIHVYHVVEWTFTYACQNKQGRTSPRYQGTGKATAYWGTKYTSTDDNEIVSNSTHAYGEPNLCPTKGAFTRQVILSRPRLDLWEVGADNDNGTQFRCIASRETSYGCDVPRELE